VNQSSGRGSSTVDAMCAAHFGLRTVWRPAPDGPHRRTILIIKLGAGRLRLALAAMKKIASHVKAHISR
jgi:hypothetical protein